MAKVLQYLKLSIIQFQSCHDRFHQLSLGRQIGIFGSLRPVPDCGRSNMADLLGLLFDLADINHFADHLPACDHVTRHMDPTISAGTEQAISYFILRCE